jgi:uncharacterized protein YjbI with pentapeptide repeats
MTPQELQAILAAHARWLATNGQDGTQANLAGEDLAGCYLSGTDLRRAVLWGAHAAGADFTGANLKEAQLGEADLREAVLAGADLEGAVLGSASLQGANLTQVNLREADLQSANLAGAILREASLEDALCMRASLRKADLHGAALTGAHFERANLHNADLREASGIVETAFRGADLGGAQVPGDQLKFAGLDNVAEASKNAGKLFVSLLTGGAYAWIIIMSTTDVALLTNATAAKLPLIDTEIPVAAFYLAAPLVLLALSLYFHLYLQRLWELLADLPAAFPDGTPLDKKVYPWAMNGLIYTYLTGFQDPDLRPPLMRVQTLASHLFAWGTVPIVLLLFWLQYLRSHDWSVTGWQILFLAASAGMSAYYQALTRITLQGNARRLPLRKHARWVGWRWFGGALAAAGLLSWATIQGPPCEGWIFRNFVDLRDTEVSTKPASWTGKAEVELTRHGPLTEEEIALMKKANLKHRNLHDARASRALLINADLRGADLTRAILQGANLRDASLQGARLPEAILWSADLQGASLEDADLRGAQLYRADLRGADLERARLGPLPGATPERMPKRDYLEGALFDSRTRWPDGFPVGAHRAVRAEPGTVLHGRDLRSLDLRDADLQGANLSGADLRSATFTQVQHLQTVKLHGARYNPATHWPPRFDPQDRRYGLRSAR